MVVGVSNLLVGTIDLNAHHNLQNLIERGRGQRFIVKKGRLVKMSSFRDKIYNFLFHAKAQRKVKKVITRTLKEISVNGSNQQAVQKLFFETLKPLSRDIYDRGECISDEIEQVLAPKLKGEIALTEYAMKVEKVRLAVKLGVEFEPIAAGQNGSYFGLDRFEKKVVVFKPFDEEGLSENSPKMISKIKRFFIKMVPIVNSNGNTNREQCYLNEVGAGSVDAFLKLNVIPITKLETFKSNVFSGDIKEKIGSCQLFEDGTIPAEKAYRVPNYLPYFLKKTYLRIFQEKLSNVLDQEQFEKMVFLDFLIGNQDRHLQNFLVKGKNVVVIDNGLSFPLKKPNGVLSLRHQYYWRHLPQATKAFGKDSKSLAEKLKDPNEKEQLFSLLKDTMKDGKKLGFNKEQQSEMVDRIEILAAVIEQGKTISYLGEIRTKDDFDRARRELDLVIPT